MLFSLHNIVQIDCPNRSGDHKLTVLPVDLILRDDDLAGVDVIGVGNGMTQDADHSNHLTNFGDTISGIAGVTDELFASGNLFSRKPQFRNHFSLDPFFRETNILAKMVLT